MASFTLNDLNNKKMNKGDIKATVILAVYIIAGALGAYCFKELDGDKEGVYIIGSLTGIMSLTFLVVAWHFIRSFIND